MKKSNIIIIVGLIILIILIGGIIIIYNNLKNDDNASAYNIISYDISKEKEVIKNITIQGIVELNHNGYIYIFNGQHFGEYGFEIEGYTRSNIYNKNQVCIDYYTSKKYDTSYIQEGDILICTGDLKKYYIGDNDLDTKNNPIIVLKAEDYSKMKKDTLNNQRDSVMTIGEYYDDSKEIYIKYDISDKEYSFPFVLKFYITEDTKITGKLEKGKKVKVQYKDVNVQINELEIKSIVVVE